MARSKTQKKSRRGERGRKFVWVCAFAMSLGGLVSLVGCGGADANTNTDPSSSLGAFDLRFQMHSLACEKDGLQARLESDQLQGSACPLSVTESRLVEGSCLIETGKVHVFTLVYGYFVPLVGASPCGEVHGEEGEETCFIRAAEISSTLDLRVVRRKEVVLQFDPVDLVTAFDDDRDGVLNLAEFCLGTDPLVVDDDR
ncbi:MAG: hypothetical protein IPK13_07530 [Deltaproteobacteria bacterium]|nr:hypothetical protein [Deltaproteobacteria bacterium]